MKIKIKKDRPGISRIFFDDLEVKGLIKYTLTEHTMDDNGIVWPTLSIELSATDLELEGED